jgi:ABC-type transport system involved in cytochrome c biogenesis permease subunit
MNKYRSADHKNGFLVRSVNRTAPIFVKVGGPLLIAIIERGIACLTSLRLTVVSLSAAVVLVFAGTLAQVDLGLYETQVRFFRSLFVIWTPAGTDLKIPVWPGGWLVGMVLLANLIAAHFKRFHLTWKKAGILLVHFGLIALLVGQFLTELMQVESFMVIRNGESKIFSEDGRKNELAVVDITDSREDKVVAIPESLVGAKGEVKLSQLPFTIRVKEFFVNSVPVSPKKEVPGRKIAASKEFANHLHFHEKPASRSMNSENMPSALVEVIAEGRVLGEWGVSTWLTKHGYKEKTREFLHGLRNGRGTVSVSQLDEAQRFTFAGRSYVISLRPVRYYKPYSIDLIKFTHARYKGTDIPKDFSSHIRIRNPGLREDREALIYMNNPLRYGGETYYQGGFLDQDSGTILQVVRNPAWLTPYLACVVVGAGLLVQFSMRFFLFLKNPSRNRSSFRTGTPESAGATFAMKRPSSEGRQKQYFSWIILALVGTWIVSGFRSPKNPTEFNLDEFGRLPVLANGRIQPIDSFARNSLLAIHGTQTVRPSTNDPTQKRILSAREWLLELMTHPEQADKRRIFRLENMDLRNLLGAREGRFGQIAFDEIEPKMGEITREARQISELEQETGRESQLRNGYEKDVMHLYQSLILYKRLKNAIQPEDAGDMNAELKAFRDSLPRAMAVIQKALPGDYSHSKTNVDVQRLSLFMKRYLEMTQWGHPMLIPPPNPETDRDAWSNVGTNLLLAVRSGEFHPAIEHFAEMASSFRDNEPVKFNRAVAGYRDWLIQNSLEKEVAKGTNEFLFMQLEPFYKTMFVYLIALLLACGYWLRFSPWLRISAYRLLILAFVLHTVGLAFRMWLEGRPPVTNLYSSAVFVGWGAVLLGIILERLYPEGIGTATAGCIGFITLIVAHNLALGGDTMEMMRAVLDTNVWLATHVVIINIGYAATALAGFLGLIYVTRGFFTQRLSPRSAKGLVQMTYGTTCFATLFTFVGTVLGGLWADQSWGRFWGWDPKENGALLIVLINAVILHARWGGLIQDRGLMGFVIVGNIATAWSWFGTNMLGVGLHSYGFMNKGFQWLVLFVVSQVVFILFAAIPLRHWRSFKE